MSSEQEGCRTDSEHACGSVSLLISQIREGDDDAIRVLWNRYSAALIGSAQKHLLTKTAADVEAEELANSVFYAFYRGITTDRLNQIDNRAGFWAVLLLMTRHKAIDRFRKQMRQKRTVGDGVRQVATPLQLTNEMEVPSLQATPDILAESNDLLERLISRLSDEDPSGLLAQIAVSRIAGVKVREIAESLGRTVRTVERKLERIRMIWSTDSEFESKSN